VQQVYLCTLLVAVGRVQFDWINPQIVTHLSGIVWNLFHLDFDRESVTQNFASRGRIIKCMCNNISKLVTATT